MSTRIISGARIALDEFTIAEEVTVYATTRAEALAVDVGSFVIGSTLFIIGEGEVYMLDADGSSGGVWRSVKDGSVLQEGGDI
ncbi:MAG: hypothetical protein E7610_05560 [Ruminococcaceae bacterium]|nr:hypothetical protein [Oscillospiraceae bacterium]